jgi:acyl CoA:acetate/3-ketoacid CoA transferase alpha subunit
MPIKFKPGGMEAEILSKPKERKTFNGRDYILEESLFADYALVKAYKGDTLGNLVYRYSARNFN